MATAPPLLSIEQYLRTSYKPDVHFVDGYIEERNGGEYNHSRTQTVIAGLLHRHEKAWQTNTLLELRIRVAANRVRICDVVALRADAPRESVIQTPPLICIEVLSPEDRLSRARLILQDYLNMASPTSGWSIPCAVPPTPSIPSVYTSPIPPT